MDSETQTITEPSLSFLSRVSNSFNKILSPLSKYLVYLGGLALLIITLTIVLDTFMRSVFQDGLSGAIDIVTVMLPLTFFSGVALSQIKGDHIVIDVFVNKFSKIAQAIITVNSYLLSFVVVAILSWQLFDQSSYLMTGGTVTPILKIPEWITVMILGVTIIIYGLTILNDLIKSLDKLLDMKVKNGFLCLLPGIVVSIAFVVLTMMPNILPFRIVPSIWGTIIFFILFVLIFLKIPVALAMGIAALVGFSHLSGTNASLINLSTSTVRVASTYIWAVMPLFMWMGELIFISGFAKDLYSTSNKWVGHFPGGLASATVLATTGLAAMVGDTLSGIVTMGTVALPEMKKYKYDRLISITCICTASTIGILIPPSIGFVVYGMITGTSITKLFMAGIIPGILLSLTMIAIITTQCIVDPNKGPRVSPASWRERIVSLKDIILVALVIIVVIGGLYSGLFTPTEAGAIGAFATLILGIAARRIGFKDIFASTSSAINLVSAIMIIFIFATTFSQFVTITRLPSVLANFIIGLGLSNYTLITVILIFYLILGCILNAIPGMILSLPVVFPIVQAAGFDPIWFGVLAVIMIQVGSLTPPIGMNVFAISALAKDVPIYHIYRAELIYLLGFLIVISLIVVFPQIALFLPNSIM